MVLTEQRQVYGSSRSRAFIPAIPRSPLSKDRFLPPKPRVGRWCNYVGGQHASVGAGLLQVSSSQHDGQSFATNGLRSLSYGNFSSRVNTSPSPPGVGARGELVPSGGIVLVSVRNCTGGVFLSVRKMV